MARRNQTKAAYFPLGGGLDITTPPLSVNPGHALAMVNFEPYYTGGYRRVRGFERYDGRPKPSDATFTGFDLEDATGLSVGDTLTGDDSSASGVVCGISGNSVAVTKVTGGPFTQGEDFNSGTYTMEAMPLAGVLVAPDEDTSETFLLGAEDEYRDDIGVVPGSGDVLGVWRLKSAVYAVRNNAGATAAVLHKASASGWTTTGVTMADYLFFDGGGGGTGRDLPEEGDTISGVTSGASATVHRVVVHAGTTAGNDAAGYVVLTGVSGGPFQNNEELRESGTKWADADGANATFAFPVGGTYRFHNHNFFGGSSSYRAYGCNGVGPAFEIDEDGVVSPILHPQTALDDQPASNVPYLVDEHRNYLWLAFPGGSLQHSVIGEPLQWNGFLGAAEFGIGDEITGMRPTAGGTFVIVTERESRALYGKDDSDFELRLIGEQTGGKLYSVQSIDTVYSLDDLGITSMARTDAFGDFIGATISQRIQPLIVSLRDKVNDSTIVRRSNQYRVYFNDNSAIVMYVPGVEAQSSPGRETHVEFGFLSYPLEVKRIYNVEDENGVERTYFASDDGYVYEDQIGRNFDGEEIDAYVRLPFNQVGSPSVRKRFRRADLELAAQNRIQLQFASDLSYGEPNVSSSQTVITISDVPELAIFGGGGFWDDSNWDEFLWDAAAINQARAQLSGSGTNIGFLIYNSSAKAEPFILQGITLHYEVRRLQR